MKETIFVLIFIFFAVLLYAQSATETETTETETIGTGTTEMKELPNKLKLDFPFFDFPYQTKAMNVVGKGFFSSYARPSMNQWLSLVTNLYLGFNFGMNYFYKESENALIYSLGMLAGHTLFIIPQIYLHEEYHRAVFTHNGINSSIIYSFLGPSPTYPDDNNLYKEKPTEYSRVYAAGIEGQHLLLNNLQRDYVFYRKDVSDFFEDKIWSPFNLIYGYTHLLATLITHNYIYDQLNYNSITERNTDNDKIGDPLYWTHALFQLSWAITDVSDEERKYLESQFWWHFLNYLSPMLFGFNNIPLGDSGLKGNFAMSHLLTSFGTDISAKVFLKYKQVNMFFVYHSYLNYEHYFFSIEAELVDYPLSLSKFGMYFSPRFIIGMQPKEQNFKTEEPEFLGLFGLRVDLLVGKHFSPYIDFIIKTNGWVAGIESLDSNVNMKVGLSLRF